VALGLVLAACGGGRDTGEPTMEAAPVTTPTTGAGSTTLAGGAVDAPELAALDPFERWRLEALHGAGDVANVAAQAGTDLPLATASALADQAGRYFAARLTGTGRNAFPADWFDPADHYRDQAARVVAVGAGPPGMPARWSSGVTVRTGFGTRCCGGHPYPAGDGSRCQWTRCREQTLTGFPIRAGR